MKHKQIVNNYMNEPHQLHIQNNLKNMINTYSKELLIKTLQDMSISTVKKKVKKVA